MFIARVRERVHRYLYGPGRPAFLAPLGVFLTFTMFAIHMTWTILVSRVPLPLVDDASMMAHLASRVVADNSFEYQY